MEIIVATMLLMFTAVLDFQDKGLVFLMNIDQCLSCISRKSFPMWFDYDVNGSNFHINLQVVAEEVHLRIG